MEIEEIKIILKKSNIKNLEMFFNCSTRNLSTFRLNGRASILIVADSDDALISLLNILNEVKASYYIIGKGSNTLINDNCNDVLIKLGNNYDFMEFSDNGFITAGASSILGKFVTCSCKNNYDFSFLAGIPGTIGGAVYGNCGTKLEGICDYVDGIEYIKIIKDKALKEKIKLKTLNYGYRFLKIKNLAVITKVFFKKDKIQKEIIFNNIKENIKFKKSTQPLNTFNCGCFFKNPLNLRKTSGELIDNLNLKGFIYGGAAVSKKHANFIENINNATSEDVISLAKIISGLVKENFNINLDYEVKLVGF